MIRVVPFASCYIYSPQGRCPVSDRSRLMLALLKAVDPTYMVKYAGRVRKEASGISALNQFFHARDILVPIPGSAPLSRGVPWVAQHLASALVGEGLGLRAWAGIRRAWPVRKSSAAPAGARPSVARHYDSFAVEPCDQAPDRIVLIDDVVTKGRTLLAAATRMHEAYPSADIRAFALVRTMGLVAEIERLIEPVRGEIRWRAGDAQRSP